MSIIEIIIIGIGLAMDASAVAMTNGMIETRMKINKMFYIALTFGILQGLMPIIGFYSGKLFEDFITNISHYIAFLLLIFLGIRMIYESFKKEEIETRLTNSKIFIQGIATSIDAFIVGVTFAILEVKILNAALIIIAITIFFSFISIYIGRLFGNLLKNKAEIFGGLILISIAIRILIEGLSH